MTSAIWLCLGPALELCFRRIVNFIEGISLICKNWIVRSVGVASVLLGMASGQTLMSQSRIQGVTNSQERVVVKGSTSSLLARSVDAGRMSGGQNLGRMLLLLAPTAE